MLKHRCLDNVQACSPSDVCSGRMNRELQRRARSNGYSVMVSAEEHGSVNELVPHHRVVLDVVRDAQTSVCLGCTKAYSPSDVCSGADEQSQRVTETSSE